MIKKVANIIHQYKNLELIFLSITLILFSLLRLPSLVEPDWYGDEGIYQVIGMALQEGRILYKEIWDNKPPLLYIFYAFVNGDLFSIRLLSLLFGIGASSAFFFLAKKLFTKFISIIVSTSLFAILFATPYLEGNIANAENFILLPILLAFLILFKKSENTFSYVLASIFLSVAFLIKIVGLFDFLALFTILLILKYKETRLIDIFTSIKESIQKRTFSGIFRNEIFFVLSFFAPIIVVSLYFLLSGAFFDYIRAVYLQNIGYVGYGNTRFFPMSLLILKLILLCGIISIIVFFREKLNKSEIIIFVWLSFSLFNTYFSQRPYTHYLLVSLPSFCLLTGLLFEGKKRAIFYTAVFGFLIFVIYSTFSPYKKILPYYFNYFDFITGKKNVSSYQSFFDSITPRDYALAQFISQKTKKEETVFLWSDSGQIYALSGKLPPGRYIVSYHITFYPDAISETKKSISEKKPKYIIATKESPELYQLLTFYTFSYALNKANIYERNN